MERAPAPAPRQALVVTQRDERYRKRLERILGRIEEQGAVRGA